VNTASNQVVTYDGTGDKYSIIQLTVEQFRSLGETNMTNFIATDSNTNMKFVATYKPARATVSRLQYEWLQPMHFKPRMTDLSAKALTSGHVQVKYTTTVRDVVTINFYLEANAPSITHISSSDPGCTVTVNNSTGLPTSTVSSMTLQNGEEKVCRYKLSYTEEYSCTDNCTGAPIVTATGLNELPITISHSSFPIFTQVDLSETYGAFNKPNAGFTVRFTRVDTQSFPTLNNTFGFNAGTSIPVYEITDNGVSPSAIGYYTASNINTGTSIANNGTDTAIEHAQMMFTLADGVQWDSLGTVNDDGYITATNVWAIPVFDAGVLLPTLAPVVAELSTGDSIVINNGDTVYTHSTTAPTDISPNSVFNVRLDLSSNRLDPLGVDVDVTSAQASFVVCAASTGIGSTNAVVLSSTSPASSTYITVPTNIADTSTAPVSASYSILCTFLAGPSVDQSTPTSITFTVYRNHMPVVTSVANTPSTGAKPVVTTKLTISVASEDLLDGDAVVDVLNKVASAFKSVDITYDTSRFRMISQELDLSDPYESRVLISVHVMDVPVSVANDYTNSINNNLSQLQSHSSTFVGAQSSQISQTCAQGCNSGDACGLCVTGTACEGDDCKENGTNAVGVSVAVILSVVAMLICM
jgi:hypothetical protein